MSEEREERRLRIEEIVKRHWPCEGSRWVNVPEKCRTCCGYGTIAGRPCPLCEGHRTTPSGKFHEPESLDLLVDALTAFCHEEYL